MTAMTVQTIQQPISAEMEVLTEPVLHFLQVKMDYLPVKDATGHLLMLLILQITPRIPKEVIYVMQLVKPAMVQEAVLIKRMEKTYSVNARKERFGMDLVFGS